MSNITSQSQLSMSMESYPPELQKYQLLSFLGRGAYGEVCLYGNKKLKVAVKFENVQSNNQVLTLEALTLKRLTKESVQGIPRHIDHGLVEYKKKGVQYNFLMMEFVDQSIIEYFDSQAENKLSFGQICVQMLAVLKSVHEYGYLHKDIKPENFRIKDNQVYLIDFGLTREYIQNGKNIINWSRGKMVRGTPLFLSLNTHYTYEYSRRDDLISLGYTILYLSTKSLPWEKTEQNSSSQQLTQRQQLDKIQTMKEQLSEDLFANPRDKRIVQLIDYLNQGLKSEEHFYNEPDYNHIEQLLLGLDEVIEPITQENFKLFNIEPYKKPQTQVAQIFTLEVTKEKAGLKRVRLGFENSGITSHKPSLKQDVLPLCEITVHKPMLYQKLVMDCQIQQKKLTFEKETFTVPIRVKCATCSQKLQLQDRQENSTQKGPDPQSASSSIVNGSSQDKVMQDSTSKVVKGFVNNRYLEKFDGEESTITATPDQNFKAQVDISNHQEKPTLSICSSKSMQIEESKNEKCLSQMTKFEVTCRFNIQEQKEGKQITDTLEITNEGDKLLFIQIYCNNKFQQHNETLDEALKFIKQIQENVGRLFLSFYDKRMELLIDEYYIMDLNKFDLLCVEKTKFKSLEQLEKDILRQKEIIQTYDPKLFQENKQQILTYYTNTQMVFEGVNKINKALSDLLVEDPGKIVQPPQNIQKQGIEEPQSNSTLQSSPDLSPEINTKSINVSQQIHQLEDYKGKSAQVKENDSRGRVPNHQPIPTLETKLNTSIMTEQAKNQNKSKNRIKGNIFNQTISGNTEGSKASYMLNNDKNKMDPIIMKDNCNRLIGFLFDERILLGRKYAGEGAKMIPFKLGLILKVSVVIGVGNSITDERPLQNDKKDHLWSCTIHPIIFEAGLWIAFKFCVQGSKYQDYFYTEDLYTSLESIINKGAFLYCK